MDRSNFTDEQPAKRRRVTPASPSNQISPLSRPSPRPTLSTASTFSVPDPSNTCASEKQPQAPIPVPTQAIASFITQNIPQSYSATGDAADKSNSRFCYRHDPDVKCRRQVDEPSMEQLQRELGELPRNDQEAIGYAWTVFSAAPAKQRQLMLQGILGQCCFSQLSFLSSQVKELIRIDFMSALPTELALKILTYLDTTSLCKAAQVSQRWRQLADDDVVWHRMCEQHIKRKCTKCGWGLPLMEQKRLRATKRHLQARQSIDEVSTSATPFKPTLVHQPTPPEESSKLRPWKDVYKDRFKVGCNWKHGRYTTKVLRGHTNGVTCLQFDESILASGSYDSTIKIWSLETFAQLRSLKGHTSGIRCLQFDESKLISGSLDKTLKVWNWRTGECLRTLTGHSSGVISVHFVGTTLVSGSIDTTVRVWNFEDKSTAVLRGHTDWVNCVKYDAASNVIFSSSDDLEVRMWDVESRSTLRVFTGHVGQVQQVTILPPEFELDEPDENTDDPVPPPTFPSLALARTPSRESTDAEPPRYILTSGLDSTIRLWDTRTGHSLRTLFGHIEGVWALAADNLRVVSGSEDRMVKVWDARSGKCERTIAGHTAPVACLGLGDSRLASGAEDGEVRIYDFRG